MACHHVNQRVEGETQLAPAIVLGGRQLREGLVELVGRLLPEAIGDGRQERLLAVEMPVERLGNVPIEAPK
jgi:hypothetical protein